MEFKIDDFIVYTNIELFTYQIEIPIKNLFDEQMQMNIPKTVKKKIEKTRDITVFNSLNFIEKKEGEYYRVISDIFVFIDLIEILKAFAGKKLEQKKEYKIGDSFTAKIAQKDGNISLKIHFKNYSNSLFLDKFECSSLAAKFSKILQKCEPWQEQDQ